MLFPEERQLRQSLIKEWHEEIRKLAQEALGVFAEKGQTRDRESVVWERLQFPHGFMTIIQQKVLRVPPMLEEKLEEVHWSTVVEELLDVAMYCFILSAIIRMLQRRAGGQKR